MSINPSEPLDNPDNPDKPDKNIETVWYGIKTAVKNISKPGLFDNYFDIDKMSVHLNNLQSKQEYNEIEKNIQNYISKICIGYVLTKCSLYDCQILDTHIKRWNKVAQNYTFFIQHDIRSINQFMNIFYIYTKYLDYKRKNKEIDEYFDSITYDNLNLIHLMGICIKYKYSYFLDKLSKCFNVIEYVNKEYHCNIPPNTKANKILSKINSKTV